MIENITDTISRSVEYELKSRKQISPYDKLEVNVQYHIDKIIEKLVKDYFNMEAKDEQR